MACDLFHKMKSFYLIFQIYSIHISVCLCFYRVNFQDINVKDEEIARLKAEYKLSMEEHLASSSERYVYNLYATTSTITNSSM